MQEKEVDISRTGVIVENCPKCGSPDFVIQSIFIDKRQRIYCKDCGNHTKWHLPPLFRNAVDEWNGKKE